VIVVLEDTIGRPGMGGIIVLCILGRVKTQRCEEGCLSYDIVVVI
jgi:hypothetical protein